MAAVAESRNGEIERLQLIIKMLQRAQFVPSASIPIRWRSLWKTSTAMLRALMKAVRRSMRWRTKRRARRRPGANRCPIIYHARMSGSMSIARYARAAGARSTLLARAQRDAGLGSGAASRHAHCSPKIRLSRLRDDRPGASAPERPIAGGMATPALLAQVLIANYCDHTPLYRQSQIFARHGVDLSRSTLARWVGGACWWLEALHDRLWQATICLPTTRRFRCSIRDADARKRGGCGSMRANSGHAAGQNRRRRFISTRRTARLNVRSRISKTSAAFCTSTAMPASSDWPPMATLSSPRAAVDEDGQYASPWRYDGAR